MTSSMQEASGPAPPVEPPALLSVGFLSEVLDHLEPVAVLASVRDHQGTIRDFAWRFANHAACRTLGLEGDELIHTTLRNTRSHRASRHDVEAVLDAIRRVVETGVDTSVHLPWPVESTPFGAPVRAHRLGDGVLLQWATVLDGDARLDRPVPVVAAPEQSVPAAVDWIPDDLGLILDGAADGIMHVDGDHTVRFSNRRAAELLTAAHLSPGERFEDLDLPVELVEQWQEALHIAVDGGDRVVFDHTSPSDVTRHIEIDVSPVSAPDGGTVTTIRDITDHVVREQSLTSLARRDPLTGLDNRSEVAHELERALASAARTGRPVALLTIDLDGFKYVNDSFGHHVGDDLLRAAADRLRGAVRSGDQLSRSGGDEFVVVCRDLRRADDALRSAWRIVEAFRAPFPVGDLEVVTTASVGVAVSNGTDSVTEVIEQADAAVYAAKAHGRDTVATFDSVLQSEVDRRHRIETDLRAAAGLNGVLAAGQLEVWYQPIFRLAAGVATGAEALLRWRHPSGEVWDAGSFIDVAEDSGMLADMLTQILVQACSDAAAWPRSGTGEPLSVQINLSPRQLADHHLLRQVASALDLSGLDPQLLCVEVAESSLNRTSRAVVPNLDGLAGLGVSLAFDNFGSGMASLTQLQDFPVDVVKLDRSCTTAVIDSERARNVASGTLAAAERLGLGVVADGVETRRQAEVLGRMGYRYAQGFLFAPALPAEEFARLAAGPPLPPDVRSD